MTPSFLTSALAAITLATASLAQGPGSSPPIPPVPVPPENPITEAKRVLGKMLFWEEQMSSDNTTSCGTCHLPEFGGSDARPAPHPGFDGIFGTPDDVDGSVGVARSTATNDYVEDATFGFGQQSTGRNSQPFFGKLWSTTQFWDGRATGQFIDPETQQVAIQVDGALESQAVGPPLSDVEMAHEGRDWSQITAKLAVVDPMRLATNLPADITAALAGGVDYPTLFAAAFGDPAITARRIAFAIATYERTLVADQTPWDDYMAGNVNAMTQDQIDGWFFFTTLVCVQCHEPPLFSDNRFHNIGLRPWQEDEGRKIVTGSDSHRGEFSTPSLRNVGLRADKLMHVGWINSVTDALNFYRAGQDAGTGHVQFTDGQDPRVASISIPNPTDLAKLADFLQNGLTDPRVANNQFPFDRPTLMSERSGDQPNIFGNATAGSGGHVPQMIAGAPLAINNPEFRAGVGSGLGGGMAFLLLGGSKQTPPDMFGSVEIHLDLTTLWTSMPFALSGAAPGEGVATFKLSVGNEPTAVGLKMVGQWMIVDPGAIDGVSASEGVEWTVF